MYTKISITLKHHRLQQNAGQVVVPQKPKRKQPATMQAIENTTTKSTKDLQNEWLKNKLNALWSAQQYCGLCMETMGSFCKLTMEFAINECYSSRPLTEVVSAVLGCNIEDYSCSSIMCEGCTEKVIQAYVFIENTKKVFNILGSCVNDLLSKTTDINNELDKNCDYENANVMIVVEYDNDTSEHIKEITKGNNALLSDTHINKTIDKPVEKSTSVKAKSQNEENKRPVIIPTPRVVKYPRSKEPVKEPGKSESNTPTVSLEGGKIVIAPLITNTQSAPSFNTYKCNSCSSIFTSYRLLKEHEKSLHNTTIYQCRFCSKKYNSQQYLDVHYMASHSKSRCRHCHDLFDNDELNSHLRESHEKKVNGCNYCDLAYYTVEQLETHMKSAHWHNTMKTANNKVECVMCLRSFLDIEIKVHKCKFSCLDCLSVPCVHYSYLMSYREQILSHSTKIRCLDCDYTTKRKEHLIAHVNREHLDYHPFTCNDCGTQFYTKLSLKSHIVQFHQDLKCQYCDHEFKSLKFLENHRKLCKTINRMFNCEKCVASFNTEEELNKHNRLNHTDIVYPCTLCKKGFTDEPSLQEHHARVHNGIQFKKRRKFIECTLCDITFKNLKEMLNHEKFHDTDEMFPCKDCPKSFSSLKKVYLHKQKHYSNRTKCPGCKKLMASSYLIQHKAMCPYLKKPQNLPHICEVCSKGFLTESNLMAHQQMHAKAIMCEYCSKLIKSSSMKKHLETKHSNEPKVKQLLKCGNCDYLGKNKIELENHINKIHLKVKPYVCDVCQKAFCGKSRLDEHKKTHSENNVCYCTYCGKKFANKVCLKMHTRRHTGEKPYECNICFEKFRSSSIMKTHRLKKHQDKTIQCPLCDSMYHLVAEMRFHVKKVHWKRPEPFNYKEIVSEQYYYLFEDRRLQKLGEEIDYVNCTDWIVGT